MNKKQLVAGVVVAIGGPLLIKLAPTLANKQLAGMLMVFGFFAFFAGIGLALWGLEGETLIKFFAEKEEHKSF